MHISKIGIYNYRNFHEASITFEEGLNVVIGPNNAGKSNLLNVINFLNSDPNKKSSINDINKNFLANNFILLKEEPPVIIIKYYIEHLINFETPDSAFSKLSKFIVYNENGDLESDADENYKINALIELRYELDSRAKGDYKTLMTADQNLCFDKFFINLKTFEEQYKWTFYNSNSLIVVDTKTATGIFEVDFIEACRNIDDIGQHSKSYVSKQLKNKKAEVETLKVDFNTKIITAFADVTESINTEIETDQVEIGITDGKNKFISRFEFDSDFSEFFKYELKDELVGYGLPVEYNGLGYNNLIYIRNLIKQKKDNDYNILLIEEPESHLHPNMQYKLLKYITGLKERAGADNITIRNQIILTTHSSNISASTKIDNMILTNYVWSVGGIANVVCVRAADNFDIEKVQKLLKIEVDTEATPDEQEEQKKLLEEASKHLLSSKRHLEKYLDVTRSDLLFSSKVILVEGLTEKLLLPMLADKIGKKNQLISNHVVVIEVGGILFNNFIPISFGLGKKILCFSDCDFKYIVKDNEGKDVANDLSSYFENAVKTKNERIYEEYSNYADIKLFTQSTFGSTFETELFIENFDKQGAFNYLFGIVAPEKLMNLVEVNKSIEYWKEHLSEIGYEPTEKIVKQYLDIFFPAYQCEQDFTKKATIEKVFFANIFYHYAKNQKGNLALELAIGDKDKINIPSYIKDGLTWLFQ